MNHSTLEIFIQVAETQSVTRQQNGWAAHSPISRPAFSSWKRSLPLSSSFAATKNGVVPGRRAVSQLCPADPEPGGRGKAGSASDNPGGSLRLGAMEATAASRLPPLLTRFQQQCPQVDITLITQPTRQLTEGC